MAISMARDAPATQALRMAGSVTNFRLAGDWFRQAISVPANLNPKNATSPLQAQPPLVDHNRDRAPDSRPHIASARSNSIDWKWAASRRHSTASIHLRNLQPAASSMTRYGRG